MPAAKSARRPLYASTASPLSSHCHDPAPLATVESGEPVGIAAVVGFPAGTTGDADVAVRDVSDVTDTVTEEEPAWAGLDGITSFGLPFEDEVSTWVKGSERHVDPSQGVAMREGLLWCRYGRAERDNRVA